MFENTLLTRTGPARPSNVAEREAAGAPRRGETAVIISTRGRPAILAALVRQLASQSKPPDHVFVVASQPEDVAALDAAHDGLTVQIGRPGLTLQRNDGLALAASRFAFVVFFDDDFVPSRFWLERVTDILRKNPDVAGVTGRVLADGTRTAGIEPEEAARIVAGEDARGPMSSPLRERFAHGSNMGCNMAFRSAALHGAKFDERLPLYAWLEDHDFRGQIERFGRFVRAENLWGVHLGHKHGRLPGLKLGYSQIANAIYLGKKGTVPKPYLAKLISKNLVINTLRALRPEPFVDRRGRLRGNMMALADLVRGRLDPQRVVEL